ncbi:MAG: DUF748 domain-containing protein [Candidatus Omnitrophota bacterium]|nr:MAG: DUF748 domain-containing protein [Candidatus Omnitrophota bacterium]
MIFLVIVLVLGGIAYFGTLKFINTKGKDIIVSYVEKSFDARAHIESLYFKFPFNIEIKDFSCEDVSFKRANIFGGFYNLFTKQLVLNSVVIEGFDIKVHRDKKRIYMKPVYIKSKRKNKIKISGNRGFIMPPAFAQEAPVSDALEQEKKFSFKVGSLFLKDARVRFIDLTLGESVTFNFENTRLKVNNFEYPNLRKFKIDLSAFLRTDSVKEGNDIDIKGWVDYFYKNMNVNVSMDNVDAYTFNDYYPPFWKLEKFGVKNASLSLKANLNSQHNDLVIDGTMALEEIDFVEETEGISDKMKYLKTVVAFLKGTKDKASINVKLKTKMDSPKLDFASVKDNFKGIVNIGTASVVGDIIGKIKEAKSDTSGEGQEPVEQAVNDTIEKVKDVVDSLKDLF